MKVTLINSTPKAIETMFWAFKNMHTEVGAELAGLESSDQKTKFLNTLFYIPHQTVLEFVNMVWKFEGVSRALQQQLTRNRDAAYSIQSLRIVPVPTFDTDCNYTQPSMYPDKDKEGIAYDNAMMDIERHYNKLIELGYKTEDARGILPLNIHSPITESINMRSLVHMMELRMCDNTQYEFRMLAQQIKKQVAEKIDEEFASIFFRPPCAKYNYCNSPYPCKKSNGYKCVVPTNPEDIGLVASC